MKAKNYGNILEPEYSDAVIKLNQYIINDVVVEHNGTEYRYALHLFFFCPFFILQLRRSVLALEKQSLRAEHSNQLCHWSDGGRAQCQLPDTYSSRAWRHYYRTKSRHSALRFRQTPRELSLIDLPRFITRQRQSVRDSTQRVHSAIGERVAHAVPPEISAEQRVGDFGTVGGGECFLSLSCA